MVRKSKVFNSRNLDELLSNAKEYYNSKADISKEINSIHINLDYVDHASNTHYCPKNGVTNWHKDVKKPTGYPGYVGNINLVTKGGMDTGILQQIGIHTGTGGSSFNGRYRYDVSIFIDDFPKIKKNIETLQEDHDKIDDLFLEAEGIYSNETPSEFLKSLKDEISKVAGDKEIITTSLSNIVRYITDLENKILLYEHEKIKKIHSDLMMKNNLSIDSLTGLKNTKKYNGQV